MRTTILLAMISLILMATSAVFGVDADFHASFSAGWLAVFSTAMAGGSILCAVGAIGSGVNMAKKADVRAQQIADANLKQITARANVAAARAVTKEDYDG